MSKRAKSFFITVVVYVIALVVAVVGSYQFLGLHQWLLVLIGHLFATVVVFIASQLYKTIKSRLHLNEKQKPQFDFITDTGSHTGGDFIFLKRKK